MRRTSCFCVALLAFLPFLGGNVEAQDLLNDTIPLSNARLDLKTYAANLDGGSQLISITSRPGSDDVFVTNQFGQVFAVADNGNGAGVPTLWFDYDDSINIARNNAGNGYELDSPNQTHGGLRSIAFHPEFETNGKFYTSAMVDRPTNAQVANGIGSDFNYLGNSNSGFDAESVLAEWTVGADGSVNPNSYRELFRVRMPVFDHPIKQIIFNDFAEPGDEDYGLLYIAHGDGSTQSTSAGDGLNPLDGLGKILRINPLEEELPEPVENDDPPAANQTQLVAGFDQRYIGSTYNLATGALIDASGNGQTASAVGGNFSFTTTPNGATALQNNDAGGDTGERLQFTRNNVLGGSNGFTIQAVFAGNETPGGDGATGVIGLSETAGFSGVFLGGQPGSIEVRGGNVDNQGNSQGSFLNDGNVNNSAANGQFAIYTVVVDPDASSGNVMTATITDPLTGNVLASTAVGNPGTAIQGIGNIGALFAGEVGFPGGAFNSQDNFQGAIADVVVYNLALSPAAIAQNNEFFNEAYFGGEPIPSQPEPYTTPGNPFVDDSGTLNEIYSLGHRNPHHISFAEAADGSTHLIAAETGRDNVEEVNLVQAGANYGWGLREGTFVHENGGGYINGVSALPNNDAQNGFTYPSAQFDHDTSVGRGFIGFVIGGGFVIDNNSDPNLQGEYIFCDFGFHLGYVYHASLDDLLAAKTTLEIGESPSALTQAPISRMTITIDRNGDGIIDQQADNLVDIFGGRNDFRFGRGPNGEMFITSKQTSDLFIVTNTVAEGCLLGDVNTDGFVTFLDISPFIGALNSGEFQCEADCDESGEIDFLDIAPFISILTAN